jgi:hypothetical protein
MWTSAFWDADTEERLAVTAGPGVGHPLQRIWRTGEISIQRVAIGLRCRNVGGCAAIAGPGQSQQFLAATDISVLVRDHFAPSIAVTQAPPADWRDRGKIDIGFSANDNVGLRELSIRLDGASVAGTASGCYDEQANVDPRPCANAAKTLATALDLGTLSSGLHWIELRATDPGSSVTVRRLPLLVDHDAPPAPRALTLSGENGWRPTNRFALNWANPPEHDASPIVRAEYELCPSGRAPFDNTGCVRDAKPLVSGPSIDDLTVPHDGEWTLRLALRDSVGNHDPDRAATLHGLRFDGRPPFGEFLPVQRDDPTRVRLSARDEVSGVHRVEIEVRRQGDSSWQSMVVESANGTFSTALDDSELAAGLYDVRARVLDQAGNERTITTLGDGSQFRLRLPVRVGSTLAVGKRTRARVKSRKGRVLETRPLARYGASVSLQGRLTDAGGNSRSKAAVEVFERVSVPGGDWRYLTTVRTTSRGTFALRAPPGPSRELRFRYPGSAMTQPVAEVVQLRVQASASIRADRKRLRNGDSVIFTGRLRGKPLPAAGKLLALQARTRRGWRTFANPRARAVDGRWQFRYRFTGTTVRSVYVFRVVVPQESGYPYARGTSANTQVLVTP